ADHSRFFGERQAARRTRRPVAPRAVPHDRLPGTDRGADAAHAARELDAVPAAWRAAPGEVELDGVRSPAADRDQDRHPLRHEMDQARHALAGRDLRRPVEGGRRGCVPVHVRDGALRRRLHDQPARRRPDRRQGDGGHAFRGLAPDARAWRAGAPARAAPLLLEERQVGAPAALHRGGPGRLLGVARLPPLRRPMARAALHGRRV
ncbi:MAG: oxidoreductase molybdopterin binding protein, partial [uncultured Microvirga sp.]